MDRAARVWRAAALAGAIGAAGLGAAAEPVSAVSLERIDAFALPSGVSLQGLRIGGVSGFDRDPETGAYVALSDDRVEFGPARMFEFGLELGADGVLGLDLRRAVALVREDGSAYPPLGADPEALRIAPAGPDAGRLYWAHERDAAGRPYAGVMDRDGRALRAFVLPESYMPRAGADGALAAGVRDNYGFESLTVDAAGRVVLGLEAALAQDGPLATPEAGTRARILTVDPASGAPVAEYVYPVEPVHARPTPADGFVVSGLVELLYDPDRAVFYALERSFALGQGHVGRLYETDFEGATDVLGRVRLDEGPTTTMRKRLVATIAAGREHGDPGNVEALAFGPEIGGRRTLLVVSDDNFGRRDATRIFLFAFVE